MYRYGDLFSLTGIAISMEGSDDNSFVTTTVVHGPSNREICKTLSSDLTKIIIEYERADKIPDCMISCSGCTGSVRLEHKQDLALTESPVDNSEQIASIMHVLANFTFFKHFDSKQLKEVLKHFQLISFPKDKIIIRKGDPADNFYIIVTGRVEILNDAGIPMTALGPGDVFGEMSLICNENINATVQAGNDCEALFINQQQFKKLMEHEPSLHMYFTKLLAKRLSDSNRIRSDDYSSGMIGKLEEIPPEALFQTLNVNNKTGILTITQLPQGTARFSMRQGSLIKAKYGKIAGEAAFYDVLREKSGRFKFTPGLPPEDFDVPEIGYFMKLLMEGMQRIDERHPPKVH